MTILLTNMGTSDLAVKIDGHYLPIGFDRNEPNMAEAEAEIQGKVEAEKWRNRFGIIKDKLGSELGISDTKNFRELSRVILEKYQQEPEIWHKRLRPGRILGIIETAKKRFGIHTAYIFVTNQPEFVVNFQGEKEPNPGYPTDSIHLFHILKLWFEREFGQDYLQFKPVYLEDVSAIDLDGLLNKYYNFFLKLDKNEQILISIKGGTPQMQTALRVQAVSSEVSNQVYLEPKLSILKLLAGEASECHVFSYWRYQRIQKYQTVKQLLQRWDFDGARVILEQWLSTLKELEKAGIEEVQANESSLELLVKALRMAVGYLNLDAEEANKQADQALGELATIPQDYQHNGYARLLNLYTQCCLFWDLDRIADFLSRMGSFYEETLHELIRQLDGEKYFDRIEYPDDWYLNENTIDEFLANSDLVNNFDRLESKINKKYYPKWQREREMPKKYYKLPGRFSKLNFVQALVETKKGDLAAFNEMTSAMEKLDYWAAKRNQLIHGAKGVSKQRMKEVLAEDKRLRQERKMKNKDISKNVVRACKPEEILTKMTIISRSVLQLTKVSLPDSVMYSNPDYLDSANEPYYIYSDIRKWVEETLDRDL
ncbi:hypothetical protein [Oscillatoria salina]|uniref:hypothetical protein n=1 Tax=Oscillatoria salina TaxID=331517 RepID=UPI001CD01607|nr:hypothetical protein [Oscillatoria salina]MBZ8180524.1 hypothetical protein [Oscillatoria salina IIICB1]